MKVSQYLALVLLALPAGHALGAAKVPPDPFEVPADSLHGPYLRIALLPANKEGTAWLPRPDSLFERLVQARLSEAKYLPIPAESVLACWDHAVRAGGGIYDVRSGRRDSTRMNAATRRFESDLRDSLAADLILRFGLIPVSAAWDHHAVHWDGASFATPDPGRLVEFIAGKERGLVPAISLVVTISEPEGRVLYMHVAGVRPMMKIVGNRWTTVPIGEAVGDESGNRDAVARALAPWFERMPAAGTAR